MRKEKLEELKNYIKELTPVKAMSNQALSQGKGFVTVENYTYQLKDGRVLTRDKVLKGSKKGDAVIILPITKEKNTVLVIQTRPNVKEGVSVELPAGYVEDNETKEEAARRELKEETGFVTDQLILLGEFYQDQGISSAYNSSFLALDCQKKYSQMLDKDEFIRYYECKFEEALELLEKGYIKDLQSQYTLEKAETLVKKGTLIQYK